MKARKNDNTQAQVDVVEVSEDMAQAVQENDGGRVSVNGMVVTTKFTCKPNQQEAARNFVVQLDYSGADMPTILQWANRNRIIELQGQLRLAGKEAGYETFVNLSKSMICRQAAQAGVSFVTVDKTAKDLERRFLAMTPEQRASELAKLQAMFAALGG